jgi:hypothetical protein
LLHDRLYAGVLEPVYTLCVCLWSMVIVDEVGTGVVPLLFVGDLVIAGCWRLLCSSNQILLKLCHSLILSSNANQLYKGKLVSFGTIYLSWWIPIPNWLPWGRICFFLPTAHAVVAAIIPYLYLCIVALAAEKFQILSYHFGLVNVYFPCIYLIKLLHIVCLV